MRHMPSIQWCAMFCGAAVIGCSNTTPPQPKPEPPKAVAVAPAEVEATAKPAAPEALKPVEKPAQESAVAVSESPVDPIAALRRALAAAGGVEPADALHVGDDLEADVGGACAAGVPVVLLDREGTFTAPVGVAVARTLAELLPGAR